MYRSKSIKFKQVTDQEIHIILEYEDFNKEEAGFVKKEKQIGQIFTPSGSSENITNSIQVCGFSEAYSLWGCGVFGRHKSLESGSHHKGRQYLYDSSGEKIIEQVKDIQLYFDEETESNKANTNSCMGCFNEPCTCEREEGKKNPYKVKIQSEVRELITEK